jgi:hypothetical protein
MLADPGGLKHGSHLLLAFHQDFSLTPSVLLWLPEAVEGCNLDHTNDLKEMMQDMAFRPTQTTTIYQNRISLD